MSELKPCPFCGSEPHASYVAVSCRNEECIANAANDEPTIGLIEAWNTRPIEDALNARIVELSQAVGLITTLKPTMVMDANHPLDMAREVAEHVNASIAELEAYIDQLIEAGSALEIPGNDFGKNQKWYALVRNWKEVNKEREE